MNEVMNRELPNGCVITLKEITDLLSIRHDKAMKKVLELAEEPNFGKVSKMDILVDRDNRGSVTLETLAFTKIQAIAVAAKLDNAHLMKVVVALEQKTVPVPVEITSLQMLAEVVNKAVEVEQKQLALEKTVESQKEELVQLKETIHTDEDIVEIVGTLSKHSTKPPKGWISKNSLYKKIGLNNWVVQIILDEYKPEKTEEFFTNVTESGNSNDFQAYNLKSFYKAVRSFARTCSWSTRKRFVSDVTDGRVFGWSDIDLWIDIETYEEFLARTK